LIVGSRQIGKTSLLRHVYGRVQREGRFTPIWLEGEEVKTRVDFLAKLELSLASHGALSVDGLTMQNLEPTLRRLRPSPVLFINEVDKLIEYDPDFLGILRGLAAEQNPACQCVFTGYVTAYLDTLTVNRPFYHFTQGNQGEKMFVLGALREDAALSLLQKLEDEPLGLTWETPETRTYAHRIILERSHRIPILVQRACAAVVMRLGKARRTKITRADVDAWLAEGAHPAWDYLQATRIDKQYFTIILSTDVIDSWVDLVLGVLAMRRYPRLLSPRPRAEDPPGYTPAPSFRADDAARETTDFAKQWLDPDEWERFKSKFQYAAYLRLFDALVLTVFLGPVPGGDRELQFVNDIFPIELSRFTQRKNTTIDSYLLDKLDTINKYG
jgi:hypothetical protein